MSMRSSNGLGRYMFTRYVHYNRNRIVLLLGLYNYVNPDSTSIEEHYNSVWIPCCWEVKYTL